jgi:hypothetical protein
MPGIVEKSSATGDSAREIGSLLREKHTTQRDSTKNALT